MDRVKILMEKLDVTEAEARAILADDAKIDKGEKLFELSKEQKQAEKSMRAAGRAPTVYKFTKRERKADPDKRFLIETLELALSPFAEKVISVIRLTVQQTQCTGRIIAENSLCKYSALEIMFHY